MRSPKPSTPSPADETETAFAPRVELEIMSDDARRHALLLMLEDLEENRRVIEQARHEWTATFDAIHDPVFLHDADFRILRANRAYADLAGMSFQQLIGKRYWEVFPKGGGPIASCLHATQQRDSAAAEEDITLASGEIFRSRAYAIPNEAGRLLCSVHVLEDITASRRAAAENRLLSEALRQSAAGLVITNVDLSIRYANSTATALLKYEPGQLDRLPLISIVPSEIHEQIAVLRAQLISGGQWTGEFSLLAKDGVRIPVHLALSSIADESGKTIAYLGSLLDLRPIQQTQEALRTSEERFRTLVTASTQMVWQSNAAGENTSDMPTWQEFTGQSGDELRGFGWADAIHPDDYSRAMAQWQHAVATGGKFEGEYRFRRHDGQYRDFSVKGVPVKDASGNIREWVGTCSDITGSKEAEAKLQLSAMLLDSAGDSIMTFDLDGNFIYLNEAAWKTRGYTHDELMTINLHELDTPEFEQCIAPRFKELIEKGACTFESAHRRKDGSIMPIEVSSRYIESSGRKIIISTVRDITERKRAEDSLRQVNRALKTLSACNAALVRATDETQLLQELCRAVTAAGGYRFVWIGYIKHDEAKRILPVAHEGFEEGYLDTMQLTWNDTARGRGPGGRAVREGTVTVARNIATDPNFAPWREEAMKRGYASNITLPLKENGTVFGVVSIYSADAEVFDEHEIALLAELAEDASFGIVTMRTRIERNRLQQEHLRISEQLKSTLTDTIRAIALTVEMRDPYTAGHQVRVSSLSAAIGSELGLPLDRIEGLRLAALIHDIGKINVPAEILNRPGKLTMPEFELIKGHPLIGYDIIKDVQFPWPVAQIILQHHERLNGSGYPHGTKGEDILLEARILAVADVVEAMFSHRPYRPGLGLESALGEITQHRGTLYDNAAVDACIKLFSEKRFAFSA